MASIANAQTFQDALAAFKAGLTEGAPVEDFMGQLQSLISQFPTEFKATTEKTDAPKKRTKKERDPSLPKRPKNAFMLFTDSVREEVKAGLIEASPDGKIRVSDVSKECGARWKVLSEEDKQPFLDANAKAKTEYEKAMEEYYAENPDKKPVEKVKKEKKEKVAGGGTKKKKGFQAEFDAETAFESELPEGWKKGSAGYLSGAVKGEDGKPLKFKTFAEAIAAADKFDCGGVTRTKMAYTLRKSSTLKESTSGEVSWTRVKSENGTASSDSDSD